ncbi:MAG: class I SAM-dependent methyltransferase [Candidatus Wallbacteria bacterium]|nr:class I SAM-dependent methyltransferase [Candidatus Wallbacteria bacterium]
MELVPQAIDDYAVRHTTLPDPLFGELARETREKMEYWFMQVGPVEGTFLKLLVQLTGAQRVLEIGMFTGYSGLMMASGLPESGRLITCDIDPEVERFARRYFDRSPHGKKIDIRVGPALQTLAQLQGPFDLAFIDADKANYVGYYERCLELLRPGGLLVADNCLWGGRVLDPKDDSDHAIVGFNARVAADPRVEHVLLTVRDGVMLARKK